MQFFERFVVGALSALEFHFLRLWIHWLTVVVIGILVLVSAYLMLSAPMNFSSSTLVVKQGDSAAVIAQALADAHVITSPTTLRFLLRVSGGDDKIHEGAYRFDAPENSFSVARRLITSDYGLPSVKLTFPEGYTSLDMARDIHKSLPSISEAEFARLAKPDEGYLFPDTYSFQPSATARDIIAKLRDNFRTKTVSLVPAGAAQGHGLNDIVVMASLIEKEARTDESRRLVSGILWNRINKGMPLQVDAVFGYIFGRDTYSPSPSDLKVDSPYNTYRNKGLPPGPINNPGLAALSAAADPTNTPYLYYLTGNDGTMHYATTYEGHKVNLIKYLK